MSINKLLLFIFLFAGSILLSKSGLSQGKEVNQELSLRTVLDSLELNTGLKFTYLDEDVEGIYIAFPENTLKIDQLLIEMSQSTGLSFKKLDDGFVAISSTKDELLEICGTVLEQESELAMDAVFIQSGKEFTTTDSSGQFRFSIPRTAEDIQVSSMGFYTKTLSIPELDLENCLNIKMEVKPVLLNEIVVPDFLTRGINKRLNGSFTIDIQQLGILPGLIDPDVLQTIQTLPGILSVNERVSDINVRGGTNDQNLVLWDGIRMYQPGHFFGLISAFNPYLIKETQLIKNGTSAYYGEGVSSTINIYTDDELLDEVSGSAGINMLYADALLSVPLGSKASITLAGRRSISDLVKTPTYESYFSRAFSNTEVIGPSSGSDSLSSSDQTFIFYDLSMNLVYKPTRKDLIKVDLFTLENQIGFNENAVINNLSESRESNLRQYSTATRLWSEHIWNPKIRSSGYVYYSRYNLDALNSDIQNDQRLIQENEVLDYGLKLDTRVIMSNLLDILIGYQFSEIGVTNLEDINNPPFRRLIKEVLGIHAIIIESNFNFKNNSNLSFGLRSSYFEKFKRWTFEPRISWNKGLTEHLNLELLGELKSQSITQIVDFQTDFLGVEKRRWLLSNNQDIPLIQSKQASIGFTYNKNDLLISLEGYFKDVNGIYSLSQGFQNQFQDQRSSGKYLTYGIDILLNKRFGNLNNWISYSYAINNFTFPEFEPSEFPNNLEIPHTITAGVSYRIKRFDFSTGVNWHNGRPYTQPESLTREGDIVYESPNSSRVPNYWRWDASATYKLGNEDKVGGSIGISFWNLTNRENILSIFYEINSSGEVEEVNQIGLQFTPNLMVRIEF